ncbi:hypothetical protein ZWY2020_019794 [Hordeum vulgare]|nr:hypothetical protein ZWY2020_019794 [Hordeum vulgare]
MELTPLLLLNTPFAKNNAQQPITLDDDDWLSSNHASCSYRSPAGSSHRIYPLSSSSLMLYDSSYGKTKQEIDDDDDIYMYSVPPQSFPTSHPSLSDEEDLTARFNYVGTSADDGTGMFSSATSVDWKPPFDDVYAYEGPHSHRMLPPSMPPLIHQETKEEDLPEGVLSISLLKHQRIALAWMLSKENSSHCPGGILADDQLFSFQLGLGKTISTISLIQKERVQQSNFMSADSDSKNSVPLDLDDDDIVMAMDKKEPSDSLDHELCSSLSGSAFNNMAKNVKVEPRKKARVGSASISRTTKPTELAKYDVVVTTYTIVGQEVPKQDSDDDMEPNIDEKYGICPDFAARKKRKLSKQTKKKAIKKKKLSSSDADLGGGPLARVRWFRVVLDEAQTIKNHHTKSARACCGLKAKRRWCLSGTPMQNTIDDLYSYFRFLKYEPYSSFSLFRSMIKGPISRGSSQGYKKLQTVLKIILLRRTKETLLDGEPIIKVPPKTIELKKINFTQEERYFYLALEEGSREKFKVASIEMAKQLPREIVMNLLKEHRNNGMESRTGPKEPPENAVITTCRHIFCYECAQESLSEEEVCPVCKQKLCSELLFSRPVLRLCISDELESYATAAGDSSAAAAAAADSSVVVAAAADSSAVVAASAADSSAAAAAASAADSSAAAAAADESSSICEASYISSKIKGAVDTLKSIFNTHGPADSDTPKAIVFSQWTGMLNVLELSLNSNFINFRRLDGSMSLDDREEAVQEFKADPEVRVMLMSLKAGNLGLNMIAASHVIMLDPWWNPYAEDQAVDRAHRIGQTRPVTVTRFTVNGTVEDRILALQAKKREMVESAFGEKSGGISTRLTVEDLGYLFNI